MSCFKSHIFVSLDPRIFSVMLHFGKLLLSCCVICLKWLPSSHATVLGHLPNQCPCCPFTYFDYRASSQKNNGISRLLPLLIDLSISNTLTWICASTQLYLGPLVRVLWTFKVLALVLDVLWTMGPFLQWGVLIILVQTIKFLTGDY